MIGLSIFSKSCRTRAGIAQAVFLLCWSAYVVQAVSLSCEKTARAFSNLKLPVLNIPREDIPGKCIFHKMVCFCTVYLLGCVLEKYMPLPIIWAHSADGTQIQCKCWVHRDLVPEPGTSIGVHAKNWIFQCHFMSWSMVYKMVSVHYLEIFNGILMKCLVLVLSA